MCIRDRYVTFVAVVLVACNDYDAAQTAYEEIVDSDVTTTPPNIDSAWELQLIPNVGQHSGCLLYTSRCV